MLAHAIQYPARYPRKYPCETQPALDGHLDCYGCTSCDACVGAEDELQCELVYPADCIAQNLDFVESPDELMTRYESLHG